MYGPHLSVHLTDLLPDCDSKGEPQVKLGYWSPTSAFLRIEAKTVPAQTIFSSSVISDHFFSVLMVIRCLRGNAASFR